MLLVVMNQADSPRLHPRERPRILARSLPVCCHFIQPGSLIRRPHFWKRENAPFFILGEKPGIILSHWRFERAIPAVETDVGRADTSRNWDFDLRATRHSEEGINRSVRPTVSLIPSRQRTGMRFADKVTIRN